MNVDFKMGNGVTTSNPPIVPGQVLFDKAAGTLHIDTDDNQRLQIQDTTKMDKFGEVTLGMTIPGFGTYNRIVMLILQ